VDECQDLKEETLNLITEIFGNDQTKFTFVGDPKQNIMGFAGARADIFQLLKEKFSPQVFNKSVITLSFRFSAEVADFANHFVSAFTTHEPSNRAKKPHIGFKPHIIIVGQEADY
jgi:superfamily I DNA/RNA helicase